MTAAQSHATPNPGPSPATAPAGRSERHTEPTGLLPGCGPATQSGVWFLCGLLLNGCRRRNGVTRAYRQKFRDKPPATASKKARGDLRYLEHLGLIERQGVEVRVLDTEALARLRDGLGSTLHRKDPA